MLAIAEKISALGAEKIIKARDKKGSKKKILSRHKKIRFETEELCREHAFL